MSPFVWCTLAGTVSIRLDYHYFFCYFVAIDCRILVRLLRMNSRAGASTKNRLSGMMCLLPFMMTVLLVVPGVGTGAK